MNNSIIFYQLAQQFCHWAENPPAGEENLDELLMMLGQLYQQARQLPERFGPEKAPSISHSEWHTMFKRFGSLPFNVYTRPFNPHNVEQEAFSVADLADDLADIWRELKPGVMLYEAGYIPAAVWHWQESFANHWGYHLVGAIYAIQFWLLLHPQGGEAE